MEMVSYNDWRRQCEADPALAPLLALFPANTQRSSSKKGTAARMQIEVQETFKLLKNEGIHCPQITSDLLQTYVSYFLEHESMNTGYAARTF